MEHALITGASSGIGLEMARVMARKGHNLILTARRTEKLLDLKKELESECTVKVFCIPADLSNSKGVIKLHETIHRELLTVNILVNNAGFGQFGKFSEIDWEIHDSVIQVNIAALVHLTKLVMTDMLKRKEGKILNIASTAAFRPGPMMSVYYASKAFVLSFSEALSNELQGNGITVTALCPGATHTEFAQKAGLETSPFLKMRKEAQPHEVALCGYNAMMKGRTVAVHGRLNKLLIFVQKFLPKRWITSILRKVKERTNHHKPDVLLNKTKN